MNSCCLSLEPEICFLNLMEEVMYANQCKWFNGK